MRINWNVTVEQRTGTPDKQQYRQQQINCEIHAHPHNECLPQLSHQNIKWKQYNRKFKNWQRQTHFTNSNRHTPWITIWNILQFSFINGKIAINKRINKNNCFKSKITCDAWCSTACFGFLLVSPSSQKWISMRCDAIGSDLPTINWFGCCVRDMCIGIITMTTMLMRLRFANLWFNFHQLPIVDSAGTTTPKKQRRRQPKQKMK